MRGRQIVLWSLAVLAGALALAGLAEAGVFDSVMVPGMLHRIQKRDNSFTDDMSEDEIFAKFFPDTTYLLKPEEHYHDIPRSDEDYDDDTAVRALEEDDVSYEEYNSSEEEEDDDTAVGRSALSTAAGGALKFIKAVGKIGWTLLKNGINFLKSMFYKFGGKRLLKQGKKYLKEDLFSIDPLDCKDGECASCAILTLPFKIKQFKACAKMGVARVNKQTNFTVKFDVHKHVLFQKDFPVGNVANCFGYEDDPAGEENGIASMIGKVCVQGFEFKVDKKETKKPEEAPAKKNALTNMLKKTQVKKFCLALVFKRWATGYRFCAQRVKPKEKKDGGKKEEKRHSIEKRGVLPIQKEKDKMKSKQIASNKQNEKWKFTLKRISAGEQENQIVSETPLFKGEEEVRKNNSENALRKIADLESKPAA